MQKIYIDFDDTLTQSSKEVLRQMNNKTGKNFKLEDIKSWHLSKLYGEPVSWVFDTEEFFNNVDLCDGAIEFLDKFGDRFDLCVVSYGTMKNLEKKEKFIQDLKNTYGVNVRFVGLLEGESKGSMDPEGVYMCIDDNMEYLMSYQSGAKVLMKDEIDADYNQVYGEVYAVRNWKDIMDMIQFDLEVW